MMTDRRAVVRRRTFFKGVLSFQNGNASEDCLVRDLTQGGALIELPHPIAPGVCDLVVPSRGLRAAARMVWRDGARRGLRFEAADVAPAPKPRRKSVEDGRY